MPPEPSIVEWAAAALAAALIVAIGGQLVVGRADAGVTYWSRVAGWCIGSLASAVLLAAAVLAGAGIRAGRIEPVAGERPAVSGFARILLDLDPNATERVAIYGVGLLVPLAAVLVVLAIAAVDPARTIGLRIVEALVCSAVGVIAAAIALGDTGPLATRAAIGVVALAFGALVALALDELGRRDPESGRGFEDGRVVAVAPVPGVGPTGATEHEGQAVAPGS